MILGGRVKPKTLLEGGSGINSLIPEMPDEPPERFEAGTLPCQTICGLLSGVEFVQEYGYHQILKKEAFLYDRLYSGLSHCKRIKIYDPRHRGSIFLFNILGIPSSTVGDMLSEKGFCVRAGYHCAALAHKTLNTDADGCSGAVRVSFSIFNTADEVDALIKEIINIVDK